MGIQLGPLLETRKIKLDELSGQSVAIDGYNVLYQFLTSIRQADGTLLTDSKGRVTSHLSGIFFRFSNLVGNGLKISGFLEIINQVQTINRLKIGTHG